MGVRYWSLGDLVDADLPAPKGFLGGHLLIPGTLGQITGPDGVGKTFLALKMAQCLASGSPFGGLPTEQARVLMISEEMTAAEIKQRVHQLIPSAEMGTFRDSVGFFFGAELDLVLQSQRRRFGLMIEGAGRPNVVFVDNLRYVHAGNENDNSAMSLWMKGLIYEVARPLGVCIVFLHHFGKPSEFRSGKERGLGGVRINAECSDVLNLTEDVDSGRVIITFEKVRHGPKPKPLSYTIAGDDFHVDINVVDSEVGAMDSPTSHIRKVKELFEGVGQSMTKKEFEDAAHARLSWSKYTASEALRSAAEAGVIARLGVSGRSATWGFPEAKEQALVFP